MLIHHRLWWLRKCNRKMARSKSKKDKKAEIQSTSASQNAFVSKDFVTIFALGIVLLFSLIIRLNQIEIPFERDEGIYHYFGQLILEGKTPYVDFYEMKPPGLYYSYALLNLIFGSSLKSAHLAFILVNILTIILLFLAVRNLFDTVTGVIAAAAFSIFSLIPHASGFTTQSEHLVALYSVAALYFLTFAIAKEKVIYFLLCGLFAGMAFLVKQSAVFLGVAYGIGIVVYYLLKKPLKKNFLIKNFLFFASGVLSIILFFILLIAVQGGFSEMKYWTYEFPKMYASAIPWEIGKDLLNRTFTNITGDYKFLWILAGMGLLLCSITKMGLYKKIFLWIFALFSFLTIVPGFHFYGHYWLQLMPAAAILTGVAVYSIKELIAEKLSKTNAIIIGTGIFIIAIFPVLRHEKDYYFNPDDTEILRKVYGMNPFPESKVIADYIKKRTDKNDQIALIGAEPQIYYYTDRRCPSRHAYFTYLVKGNPRSPELQKEFIQDVEEAMPKFMVFFNHGTSLFVQKGADQTIFKWFNEFVTQHYKHVGLADMISPTQTNYIWENQLTNYKPQGQFYIGIFEKK